LPQPGRGEAGFDPHQCAGTTEREKASKDFCQEATMTDPTRQRNEPEAVGVFDDVDALYAAIDELQMHGFNRSEISMLADEKTVEEKLGSAFWSADRLEDDPDAPRRPYFSEESIGAAEGSIMSAPAYIAAVVAAGVLVTPAGSMATAIAGAALAGGAGAAVGGFLAWLFGRGHAEYLRNQIEHGGLLLWVKMRDKARQERAVEILKRHSGRDVHVHPWTTPD
jgi:hypothetical protein